MSENETFEDYTMALNDCAAMAALSIFDDTNATDDQRLHALGIYVQLTRDTIARLAESGKRRAAAAALTREEKAKATGRLPLDEVTNS
jgi:hypothetical protein